MVREIKPNADKFKEKKHIVSTSDGISPTKSTTGERKRVYGRVDNVGLVYCVEDNLNKSVSEIAFNNDDDDRENPETAEVMYTVIILG